MRRKTGGIDAQNRANKNKIRVAFWPLPNALRSRVRFASMGSALAQTDDPAPADLTAADSTSALERYRRTLPTRMLATNRFADGAYARPIDVAIEMREVAPDPPNWLRAIRLDVDRPDALLHVSGLVADGALPAPSWIVVRPASGHAHVSWELGRWVRRDRERAVALFERVREALRVVVGGNPAYAGTFTHNVFHADFERWGDGREWRLGESFAALGAPVWTARTPHRANADVAALGRNCSHFEHVRIRAYALVDDYRNAGDRAGFQGRVAELVRRENGGLADPLGDRGPGRYRALDRRLDLGLLPPRPQGRRCPQGRRRPNARPIRRRSRRGSPRGPHAAF